MTEENKKVVAIEEIEKELTEDELVEKANSFFLLLQQRMLWPEGSNIAKMAKYDDLKCSCC